ncbi:MAG: glycosyltransferase family 87 protein, partial [Flavobacteriales bacterium]
MFTRFTLPVALLCLGYLVLEWQNGRAQMADFRVYYDAANALIHGDVLYGKAFGVSSGFYKYSPFACLPFIPLALLPYGVASVLYYLLITATIIFFSLRVARAITGEKEEQRFSVWLPIITGIFLIDHLERELHLGNINLFLLVLLYETYAQLKKEKEIQAGILYGLVLLFKPHFLLLLPYFIWKRKLKTLGTVAASVGVGLLVPSIVSGWSINLTHLKEWAIAMSDHNMALQLSPNTIYGLINHLFLGGNAGSWLVLAVLAVTAISIALYIHRNDRLHGTTWSSEIRFKEYFLLVALVPNLVHTDTEHFMWVWPMLSLALYAAMQKESKARALTIALLAIAFVPFVLNSPDIVGKD